MPSALAGLSYGVATAISGVLLYANLPTRLTIGAVAPTLTYLSQANLQKIDSHKSILTERPIQADTLWQDRPALVMAVRRPGCILCRKEAAEISGLKPELDKAGVRLLAVVHETKGVDMFQPFFQGDIYYDIDRRFYGPNERWLPLWMGVLRPGTYINGYKARQKGFDGNMEGEGRLLGGVYLMDKDKMHFYHLEQEWGDAANVSEVLQAVQKLQ